jgi:hypothetical protein
MLAATSEGCAAPRSVSTADFLGVGVRFHDRGGDLGLDVSRLGGEKSADHAHHIHNATRPQRHITRH